MGCDIHPVLEKKHKFADGSERWVGISDFPFVTSYGKNSAAKAVGVKPTGYNWTPAFVNRNYKRFAKLAGVRGVGFGSKGLPDDASDLARLRAGEIDSDGHSHSWVALREALEICRATEHDAANVFLNPEDARCTYPLEYYFGISVNEDDSIDNYRVVFWFDN